MIDALHAFGLDDLAETPVHANGHAPTELCFGCGAPVAVRRKQAGNRAWCAECKAAGKPAAQRARDFRANRSKVQP